MITVLVFTDGRKDCLSRTLESFDEMVSGPITRRVIIDDSCNKEYATWLKAEYGSLLDVDRGYEIIHNKTKKGFCGAIQVGWEAVKGSEYIFHLEDDFTFNEPVYLYDMAAVLEHETQLVQLALLRQPVNEDEAKAGGLIQLWPNEYQEMAWGGFHWVEHRLFFTTNPSLYRGSLIDVGWPGSPACESAFTEKVKRVDTAVFAYWGRKDDPPKVHHIGDNRVGEGY